MKFLYTALAALFFLVGIAPESQASNKFYTLECPQGTKLQTKKQAKPNTMSVRCAPMTIATPSICRRGKLAKKEGSNGRDLCILPGKAGRTVPAKCKLTADTLQVGKGRRDLCKKKTKAAKPKVR